MSDLLVVTQDHTSLSASLDALRAIRGFEGEPSGFWRLYAEAMVTIVSAKAGLIAVRDSQKRDEFRIAAFAPRQLQSSTLAQELQKHVPTVAAKSKNGDGIAVRAGGGGLVGLPLHDGSSERTRSYALLFIDKVDDSEAREALNLLQKISDLPAVFLMRKSARDAAIRRNHLASILDLLALMNTRPKFLSAAMTFCSEAGSRYGCDRVSLGWLRNGRIRLEAMSNVDQFDAKKEAVADLEKAMEEAVDQNTEILYPSGDNEDAPAVSAAHESYAKAYDAATLFSIPLRIDNQPEAVCTLERTGTSFTPLEQRLARLCCDLVTRRLYELRRNDRWIGAIIIQRLREKAGKLIGYEHVGAKAVALLICLILAGVCFVPVPHHIQAAAIIRTRGLSYLTAPIDGHIEKVSVRVGDAVKKGRELLRLDQSELYLELANANADKVRYEREAEKARASNKLAEMRIAQALRAQAAARCEQVNYRLSKATLAAPFDGVVVEGDLIEKAGFPVEQGDMLIKIGRTDSLYCELEVKEVDIARIAKNTTGRLALASRPGKRYEVAVTRIEPAAVTKEKGNVFIVHASLPEEHPEWWRPGMTGVAKLSAGRRSLLWIIAHRTTDFLRLHFWW
ncbi:MAG: HlyD family efflux transporter periplasmic adaptor subunit [Chitinivibrionales bacterium]|nr:HlyD family efflux transporter periplasmic adaptor subunit [Chitinivibrionales bacterium]MBD3356902.1 HlyD family efflux transporter periplasmic adaptor subunit [Chitinivibrionales bacterium]